jgi:HicB family
MARRQGQVAEERQDEATHSGRLLVRMPPTLHADLARAADNEGISLNSLIVGVLAGAVAWRHPDEKVPNGRAPEPAALPSAEKPAASPAPGAAEPDASKHAGTAPTATDLVPRKRSGPRFAMPPDRGSQLSFILLANLVVMAIVGIIAIVVLIAAWPG